MIVSGRKYLSFWHPRSVVPHRDLALPGYTTEHQRPRLVHTEGRTENAQLLGVSAGEMRLPGTGSRLGAIFEFGHVLTNL